MKPLFFDAFGTLVYMQERPDPFKRLLLIAQKQNITLPHQAHRLIMSRPWGLADTAEALKIQVNDAELAMMEQQLKIECESITFFPEAEEVVASLQDHPIAVVSNLGLPYGEHLKTLLGDVPLVASYTVGAVKPQKEIFEFACLLLGVQRAVMIGDTPGDDYLGAQNFGLDAILVERTGGRIKNTGKIVPQKHIAKDLSDAVKMAKLFK